jgi:hypothetical protein
VSLHRASTHNPSTRLANDETSRLAGHS